MYSKQMHLNKTSRVAGPGSRGQTNNGDLYQKPGRNVKANEDAQPSGFPPGRIILVLAIVVSCFGILWPRMFSTLVFGEAPATAKTDDDAIFTDPSNPSRGLLNPEIKESGSPHPPMEGGSGSPHRAMEGGQGRKSPPLPVRTIDKEWKASGGPRPGMRPTMGGPGMQPPQPKAGGTMGVLMPMYTIAIIVFFVYITFKVMFKNKENEDDEEEVDKKLFADNTKYDDEYYRNYIKQYSKDDRSSGIHPQQEKKACPQNLSSESISKVEDILEEDAINNIDSGNECVEDHDIKEECNGKDENLDESEKVNKKTEEAVEETNEKDKEEEQISKMDPRDVEIKLLKARLEQTEAALERIVAHMGSVTDRLARNGVMMGDTQHKSCSKNQQENTG